MNCKIIDLIKVEENNKIDKRDTRFTTDVAIKEELNYTAITTFNLGMVKHTHNYHVIFWCTFNIANVWIVCVLDTPVSIDY